MLAPDIRTIDASESRAIAPPGLPVRMDMSCSRTSDVQLVLPLPPAGKNASGARARACWQAALTDAILVLNAGSSSLKFSVFPDREEHSPQLALRGQIEGILTTPCFSARDASGATLAESDLGAAAQSTPACCHTCSSTRAWIGAAWISCSIMSRGCWACAAFRATCARCSPATTRVRRRLSTCSSTASYASSVPLPPRWMRWCSPRASARTRRRSAHACAALPLGSTSKSTTMPMRPAGPRISRPGSPASAWVLPTNEELMIALHARATLALVRGSRAKAG